MIAAVAPGKGSELEGREILVLAVTWLMRSKICILMSGSTYSLLIAFQKF